MRPFAKNRGEHNGERLALTLTQIDPEQTQNELRKAG